MQQAQEMQEQMAAGAGGGREGDGRGVRGRRDGDGDRERRRARSRSSRIDPKAIDPDDPEMLADLVHRRRRTKRSASAHAKVEAKMKSMLPPDLGGSAGRGSRRRGTSDLGFAESDSSFPAQ